MPTTSLPELFVRPLYMLQPVVAAPHHYYAQPDAERGMPTPIRNLEHSYGANRLRQLETNAEAKFAAYLAAATVAGGLCISIITAGISRPSPLIAASVVLASAGAFLAVATLILQTPMQFGTWTTYLCFAASCASAILFVAGTQSAISAVLVAVFCAVAAVLSSKILVAPGFRASGSYRLEGILTGRIS